MKRYISRRRFLKNGASALALSFGTVGVAVPTLIPGRAIGLDGKKPASETILLGGIGINHRGGYDLGFFLNQPDVRFVAIADVAKSRRERVKKQAEEAQNMTDVAMYRDFRYLLDREDGMPTWQSMRPERTRTFIAKNLALSLLSCAVS